RVARLVTPLVRPALAPVFLGALDDGFAVIGFADLIGGRRRDARASQALHILPGTVDGCISRRGVGDHGTALLERLALVRRASRLGSGCKKSAPRGAGGGGLKPVLNSRGGDAEIPPA